MAAELFEFAFELPDGRIELLAEITIDRDVVLLEDVAVYPVSGDRLQIGPAVVRKGLRELARHFAGSSQRWLIIRGVRLTGANPGHVVEHTVPIPEGPEEEE